MIQANRNIILTSYIAHKEQLPHLASTAIFWQKIASEKRSTQTDATMLTRLNDSAAITTQIAQYATNFYNGQSEDPVVFFICEDLVRRVQAIATVWIDPEKITLLLLATNPVNLCPSAGEFPIKGAGQEIVFQMIKTAIARQIGVISLRSVSTAIPFYASLGFEDIQPKSKEGHLKHMVLTTNTIWKRYAHFIAPHFAA
jgi:hypothetical protein